jgi:hypothetical protein
MKSFLSVLIISNIAYAEDAVLLQKNDPAPYQGFLLPKEKVQELYNATIERDSYKAANDSFEKSLKLEQTNSDLKDQKINLLLEQDDKLAKALYNSQSLNNWEKAAFFIGGILVTGLAIKGLHEVYR